MIFVVVSFLHSTPIFLQQLALVTQTRGEPGKIRSIGQGLVLLQERSKPYILIMVSLSTNFLLAFTSICIHIFCIYKLLHFAFTAVAFITDLIILAHRTSKRMLFVLFTAMRNCEETRERGCTKSQLCKRVDIKDMVAKSAYPDLKTLMSDVESLELVTQRGGLKTYLLFRRCREKADA